MPLEEKLIIDLYKLDWKTDSNNFLVEKEYPCEDFFTFDTTRNTNRLTCSANLYYEDTVSRMRVVIDNFTVIWFEDLMDESFGITLVDTLFNKNCDDS